MLCALEVSSLTCSKADILIGTVELWLKVRAPKVASPSTGFSSSFVDASTNSSVETIISGSLADTFWELSIELANGTEATLLFVHHDCMHPLCLPEPLLTLQSTRATLRETQRSFPTTGGSTLP